MTTERTPTISERVADDRARPRDDRRRTDAYESWQLFSERMKQARTICANDRHDILFVVMNVD
jgi:hypothetical protein